MAIMADQAAESFSKATVPNPGDAATGISISASLSWQGHGEPDSYDVYFGDSSPPDFIQNQPGTTYDPPGNMDRGKTYYWRIDSKKSGQADATGDEWSFTTKAGGLRVIMVM
jgi:hypothetical protein